MLLLVVVSQSYQVNVHDEYVLLGNAGLLRCLVPSFVSDFVLIDSWVGDDDIHITPNSLYGTLINPPSIRTTNKNDPPPVIIRKIISSLFQVPSAWTTTIRRVNDEPLFLFLQMPIEKEFTRD